ncbi:MAG: EMC3/TMCO1 family protein [Candidatus Woesearchaeota archaeon]
MFDAILRPLLSMNPFWAIFLISFSLALMITIIYKFMTDQELMKTLKADMKALQKEMKSLKDNPEAMLKKQQHAMEKNMKYLTHSMKPTLVTFIPIILVFGWLSSNFAYEPIIPGDEFDITLELNRGVYGFIEVVPPDFNNSILFLEQNKTKMINSNMISFRFLAEEFGEYDVIFILNDYLEFPVRVLIDEEKYGTVDFTRFDSKEVKKISTGNQKKIVLNLFGWELGWLGSYIILSIIFSIGLRKLLKLH